MSIFTNLFSKNYNYDVSMSDAQKAQWQANQAIQSAEIQMQSLLIDTQKQIQQAQMQRQYATQLQQQYQVKSAQTIGLMNEQIAANTELANYKKNLLNQNASMLETSGLNTYISAVKDQQSFLKVAASESAKVKSGYAASGFESGTGSSVDVAKNVLDKVFEESDNRYRARLSEMNKAMSDATSTRLEAALTSWNAQQQNKFLRLTTAMQLESSKPNVYNTILG